MTLAHARMVPSRLSTSSEERPFRPSSRVVRRPGLGTLTRGFCSNGGLRLTAIDFRTDLPDVRRHPVISAVTDSADSPGSVSADNQTGGGYVRFRNDQGVPEIRIGVKEFECIGVSPPQHHPHIYINMGKADTILCPYCATRFRFDPRLTPLDADPPDSLFFE
jgi:uncharacterized Zn-finger protein